MQKRIEEAMRKDDEDKKKLEKADERITYRIAKDIEKADRKRKADKPQEEQEMTDNSGARGSQDDDEMDRKKKVRFDDKPEHYEIPDVQGGEPHTGVTHGDAGVGGEEISDPDMSSQKRKREESDDGNRGMDIDSVEGTLGGMISRMSICDPEVENGQSG